MIRPLPFLSLSLCVHSAPLESDSYNQWKEALKTTTATPAGEVRALPGFKVELIRPALPGEGSWVALEFDAKGRAIISREDKGLLRLTLPENPGGPTPVETIEDSLLEVRGLLCEGDTLYANANNSRALVKLRDADGDGKYEERTTLMETPGGVGHGRNQIARHPGGALWVIGGDDVQLPAKFDAVFRNYAEDRLFTAPWDRFHWSNSVKPPCGHVMILTEGHTPKLLCGGLRNPFGIAFNEDGEAFTYDADMEWDVGLPWYRPTRVLHLVSGADYGWRGASRPIPAWMPDTWPAVCDIGKGSPTSVMFGTRSKFPERWRKALFILDWSYGIIYAVHLTPQGSTYTGQSEVFLQGRPLNVTSLDFGPDGAMYFVTGGRRTQSGLYRVTWTGEVPAPEMKPVDVGALQASRKARHLRTIMGVQFGDNSTAGLEISAGLSSPDAFTRKAARIALEPKLARPGFLDDPKFDEALHKYIREGWQHTQFWWLEHARELPATAAAEFALAAARSSGAEFQPRLLDFIRARNWPALSADERAMLLRAVQLSLIRWGRPPAEGLAKLTAYFESVIPCGQPHPDMLGAELLVFLQTPRAVEQVLPLIEKGATQEERLHYLFTLRHVKTGWTLEQRRAWIAAFRREAARAVGAHHMGVTFRYCRAEFEAALTAEEKAALAAELGTLDPSATAIPAAEPRAFVKAWTQAELEPHLTAVAAPERDLKRGGELFASQCAACHRYGPQGGVIGPDLTGIAGRFDRRTVLESLLDPWKVVADPYRMATATMKSGEIISGPVLGDDGTALSINVNPVDADRAQKIRRGDTTALTITSTMPPGLANTLTKDELFDLMAFMERGGSPE
jgi:putative heme-binding domain-containing protein